MTFNLIIAPPLKVRVYWSNFAAYDKSRAVRDLWLWCWDLRFVQNDPSSIWGVKAEDWRRIITLKSLVIDCVSSDFRCFEEFTFIQKTLDDMKKLPARGMSKKLVRLSQKERQAVVDNMKFCYWTMTAWIRPVFRCPAVPVPQFRCHALPRLKKLQWELSTNTRLSSFIWL